MLPQRMQNMSAWAERQVQNAKQRAERAVDFIRQASISLVGEENDYEEQERLQADRYIKFSTQKN